VLAEHDPDDGVRATAARTLARAAAPDDHAAYETLCRIATHDGSADVRAAAISSIRGDAPAHVIQRLRTRTRDESSEVQHAAVEALLAASDGPAAFLNRMRGESSRRVCFALRLLRNQGIPVAWRDVSVRLQHRGEPVLVELAQLFAHRDDAPLSLWLRCVAHVGEIAEEPEEIRSLVVDAAAAACDATSSVTPPDQALLHEALTVLVSVLPRKAHWSYVELVRAGIVDDPVRAPRAAITTGFGRLWRAMIRLSPRPGDYVLKPQYK
jgi:hypothetical protein